MINPLSATATSELRSDFIACPSPSVAAKGSGLRWRWPGSCLRSRRRQDGSGASATASNHEVSKCAIRLRVKTCNADSFVPHCERFFPSSHPVRRRYPRAAETGIELSIFGVWVARIASS